jgi:hypothetical protein
MVAVLTIAAGALFVASMILKFGIVTGALERAGAVITPISFMFYSAVGALIVWRRGNHSVGWLFCVAGCGWATMWFSGVVVERARFLGERAPDMIAWLSAWTELVGIACLVLALLLFPTGRLISPRWRVAGLLVVGAGMVTFLGEAFSAGPLEDHPYLNNPYPLGDQFEVFRAIGWPLFMLPVVAGASSLIVRSRRARGDERLQLKWMMFAGMLMAAYLVLWGISGGVFGSDDIAESLQGVALLSVPAGAGIAILKYRLYDIDVVVNRALVYGALTAILVGIYVGIVFGFQALLEPFTAESDLAVAGSTLAVAALFRPIRSRVQGFIDRRFYRRKFDAQRTVEEFNSHLRDEVELAAISIKLVDVARETMQPSHVSVWLRREQPSEA